MSGKHTPRHRLRPLPNRLANSAGTAAMEFALLAPFIIYIFLCATDIARALTISRRLTNAADTMAQLVSQATSTSTGLVSGTVNGATIDQAFDSIVTTFPDVLAASAGTATGWQGSIQPIVSSVILGPDGTSATNSAGTTSTCPAAIPAQLACTTATVTWSVGLNATTKLGPNYRTCGPLTFAATNYVAPSLTTLPPGLKIPGTLIVADVTYSFTPLFSNWITGPITFQRSAYLAPRFFTKLTFSGALSSDQAGCSS